MSVWGLEGLLSLFIKTQLWKLQNLVCKERVCHCIPQKRPRSSYWLLLPAKGFCDDKEASFWKGPLAVRSEAMRTSHRKVKSTFKCCGAQYSLAQQREQRVSLSILPWDINGQPLITHHLLKVKGGLVWARCDDLAIYFTSWSHRPVSLGSVGSKSLKCYLG